MGTINSTVRVGASVVLTADAAEMLDGDTVTVFEVADYYRGMFVIAPRMANGLFDVGRKVRVFADDLRVVGEGF